MYKQNLSCKYKNISETEALQKTVHVIVLCELASNLNVGISSGICPGKMINSSTFSSLSLRKLQLTGKQAISQRQIQGGIGCVMA